jgi:uncharacterized protein DUF6758
MYLTAAVLITHRSGVGVAVSCPRCGGEVRPPDLMRSEWRCDTCGSIDPLHVAEHISADVVASARDRAKQAAEPVPIWCPWPLPVGWTVTGIAWAGDERRGARATALVISGPAPLGEGPAEVAFVAEQLGVGLGNRLAGIPGPDAGALLRELVHVPPHAKLKAASHPTPLWAVPVLADRSVYVGEAKGVWLYAVTWPATAGYLLADGLVLHDLVDSMPSELVFGAPSPVLHGKA